MKYYVKIIFFLLPFIHDISSAQVTPGARFIALGSSDICTFNSWSVYFNPAAAKSTAKYSAAFYYSPSPFGMKELANMYGTVQFGASFGSFTLGYKNYGFDLYRENELRFNYSNAIKSFGYGAAISYSSLNIKNYGSVSTFNIDVGFDYEWKSFSFGFSAKNLLRNKKNALFGSPLVLRSGTTWKPAKNLSLSALVYKEEGYDYSLSGGIEYKLLSVVSVRTGFVLKPATYSGGLGIDYSDFVVNYAVFKHQILGLTHQFDVGFSFD